MANIFKCPILFLGRVVVVLHLVWHTKNPVHVFSNRLLFMMYIHLFHTHISRTIIPINMSCSNYVYSLYLFLLHFVCQHHSLHGVWLINRRKGATLNSLLRESQHSRDAQPKLIDVLSLSMHECALSTPGQASRRKRVSLNFAYGKGDVDVVVVLVAWRVNRLLLLCRRSMSETRHAFAN